MVKVRKIKVSKKSAVHRSAVDGQFVHRKPRLGDPQKKTDVFDEAATLTPKLRPIKKPK